MLLGTLIYQFDWLNAIRLRGLQRCISSRVDLHDKLIYICGESKSRGLVLQSAHQVTTLNNTVSKIVPVHVATQPSAQCKGSAKECFASKLVKRVEGNNLSYKLRQIARCQVQSPCPFAVYFCEQPPLLRRFRINNFPVFFFFSVGVLSQTDNIYALLCTAVMTTKQTPVYTDVSFVCPLFNLMHR